MKQQHLVLTGIAASALFFIVDMAIRLEAWRTP